MKEMEKIAKEIGKEAEKGADFLTIMQKAKEGNAAAPAKGGGTTTTAAAANLIVATTLRAGGKWSEPAYLLLVPVKPGATIRLNNLFFEFAKTTLLPESGVELKRLLAILQQYPKMQILIAGHTDNIGDDRSNLLLSEGQAAAVLKYLTEHGIAAPRLQSRGYGEGAPVTANDTDEHRQLNRRVEFTILKME